MTDSFKVLPAVMITCLTLFGLKAVGLWSDIRAELTGLRPAYASAPGEDSPAQGAAGSHAASTAPTQKKTDQTTASPAQAADMPDDMPAADESAAQSFDSAAQADSGMLPPSLMSSAEVDVLQSLSQRRRELDERERELDMREKLALAEEKKADAKLTKLSQVEARLKELLGQVDTEDQAQMESLVKVYETMKPKDAARIFDNLDTSILLKVAAGMKEVKIAAILAEMPPERAQALTVMLATRLDLPDDEKIKALKSDAGLGG